MEEERGKLVLVGNRCIKNRELKAAAKRLESQYELCFSDTGIEYAGNVAEEDDIVMVYDDFTDEIFAKLNSRNCDIIGPQIVFSAIATDPPILIRRRRPVYNNALKDQVICFTGFNDREQISHLAALVHYMNGAIRKDFNPNVTHLVANSSKGEKYQKAASLGRPIMQQDWIYHLWGKRDNATITGNSPVMMQFKAPPFFRCGIAFHGFSKEDVSEMEDIAMANGGLLCQTTDIDCTHVVVDDVQALPSDIRPCVAVVKAEWFWTSVQREVCAAALLFTVSQEGDENSPSKQTPTRSRYSISRSKKRKRQIRGNLAFIANESELTPGSASYKSRRSSLDQLTASILSADVTPDSSGCLLDRKGRSVSLTVTDSPSPGDPLKKTPKSPSPEKKVVTGKASAKQLVVTELLQTELNYCSILSNILKIFRDGAENGDQPGGTILSNTDSKLIFGKIPPILEVHVEIMTDLEKLLENWSDDLPVADVILLRVDKLRQAYPPFVNYFEKTKEKLKECIETNPRFHALMKVCERRAECGRQKLHELMMNIVQRLPRIELLLQQIHKYSDKKSSDHHKLEEAQAGLKDVTKYINEDKRIADERMALFEIVHDIDHCPANLLSASRNFVHKFDVDEVSDELAGRGEHLTLFLFTDSLEIVKRRNKSSSTPFKSPANSKASASHAHKSKPFKHIEFMTLASIKRIIDISISKDGEEVDASSPVFSLLCRTVTDTREKLYTFQVQGADQNNKGDFMRTLAMNIANCCCRTDIDTFIIARPAAEFMITPLELCSSNKSMTRVVSRFGKRLSRAMTIKGVASPLKRAVSTMMTPNRRSTLRRNDMSSISSTASMWELDDNRLTRHVGFRLSEDFEESMSSTCTAAALDDISLLSSTSNTSDIAKRPRKSIVRRVASKITRKVKQSLRSQSLLSNQMGPPSRTSIAGMSPVMEGARALSGFSQTCSSDCLTSLANGDALVDGNSVTPCRLQSTPLATGQLQSTPLTNGQIQTTPLATEHLQSTPLATDELQPTHLATGQLQSTPLTTGQLQSTPLTNVQLQSTPLATDHLQSTSLATDELQSTPLTTGQLQSTHLATGQLQSNPKCLISQVFLKKDIRPLKSSSPHRVRFASTNFIIGNSSSSHSELCSHGNGVVNSPVCGSSGDVTMEVCLSPRKRPSPHALCGGKKAKVEDIGRSPDVGGALFSSEAPDCHTDTI